LKCRLIWRHIPMMLNLDQLELMPDQKVHMESIGIVDGVADFLTIGENNVIFTYDIFNLR
jgi:hypothetical protein